MKISTYFLPLFSLLLSNCSNIPKTNTQPNPIPFHQLVTNAKETAKQILLSQKLSLPVQPPVFVLTQTSQCTIDGHPCIISPKHNLKPILGYIEKINDTFFITVVELNHQINYNTLIHEFAHYWLISNYSDYSHNTKYSKLFLNWQDIP